MGATGLGLGLSWRQDHLKVTDCQVLSSHGMGSEISLHRVYGARRSKELKNSFLWYGKVASISLPLPEIIIFHGYHQQVQGAHALISQTNCLRSRVSSQCLGQSHVFRVPRDTCGHIYEED
uniref:Uncharacterized protein n=1 Tax=Rhinopithecus bieti TaxID=61621 RepID=A0A2K6LAM8_RHIBE